MTKNKGKAIIAGALITGLIGSNVYAYAELNKVKDENKEEAQHIKEQQEQIDVVISQLMNKSSQYASHDDMIYSFNVHSASNRIHYKDADYYADIKNINAHTFDKNAKVKYTAEAEMTFLKDKIVNNMSYIQNELPVKLMEEGKKIAKEANTHAHDEDTGHKEDANEHNHDHNNVIIPEDSLTELEKKAKEEFVVHKWNQELSFNMDGQYIILPTSDMEETILKEFIKGIVLKDKGLTGENADIKIENSQTNAKITVLAKGNTFTFVYDKDRKNLTENK